MKLNFQVFKKDPQSTFNDLMGFIKGFMNQAAPHIASTDSLLGVVQDVFLSVFVFVFDRGWGKKVSKRKVLFHRRERKGSHPADDLIFLSRVERTRVTDSLVPTGRQLF